MRMSVFPPFVASYCFTGDVLSAAGQKGNACYLGLGADDVYQMIIVVDHEVNVQDMHEVWWWVYNNIDVRRDVVMVDAPLDVLDHASPMPGWGTKMGIDATKTWREEGHNMPWPDEIKM